jgi:hypothetical protein
LKQIKYNKQKKNNKSELKKLVKEAREVEQNEKKKAILERKRETPEASLYI